MRVAVYSIALNERRHVERFLSSCSGADVVIVADTGSQDGTPEALQAGGALVYRIAVRPWRFDQARNAALALVPADVDICVSLDLDEVLASGWREALERSWTPQTTLGRYQHVASHLPNGAPAVEFKGDRIHARFGYRWCYIVHEVLRPDRLERCCETWLEGVQVDHWADPSKSRSGYLQLLEAAVAEMPQDPRNLFLLGRDYANRGRWDDAESILRRYLAVVGQRWPQHRATALRRLARCRNAKGDHAGAIECLNEALRLGPDMRDIWLDLADVHAGREDWPASYAAATRGLALPIIPGTIGNEKAHSGGRPYYRASLAALKLGNLGEAQALAARALSCEPEHKVYREHARSVGAA